MATDLTEACAAELAAREELRKHREDAAKRERALRNALSVARECVSLASCGLDNDKIRLARSVLYLSGAFSNSAPKRGAVQDMIDWLATGEKCTYHTPATGYFGVKIYSGFGEQREDHEYGFGPKHGSTVFAVGLREPKRELSSDEREAALYYLLNIEAITTAAASAREAA
jgi:hypothetical protein